MEYLIVFIIAVPINTISFIAVSFLLGLVWGRFKISGSSGLKEVLWKFAIISAVSVILGFIGLEGFIGLVIYLAILGAVYKALFDAGWVEALVIAILGGMFAGIFFGMLLLAISSAAASAG